MEDHKNGQEYIEHAEMTGGTDPIRQQRTGRRQGHLDSSYEERLREALEAAGGSRPVRQQGHLDSNYRYPGAANADENGGSDSQNVTVQFLDPEGPGAAGSGAGQPGTAGAAGLGAGQPGTAGAAGLGAGQPGMTGAAGSGAGQPGMAGAAGLGAGQPGMTGAAGIGTGQPGMTGAGGTFSSAAPVSPPKKKAGRIIPAVIVAVLVAAVVFLRPSGWSKADAQKGTQAYLDYFFMGDDENLAKYISDMTVEELTAQREQRREEMIGSTFKESVPVSDELRTRYADFYLDLMKKARYTVGEAVKAEDGFEVPVRVEPITSLEHGDYVLMDLQLNDDLPNADLNERVYTQELESMEKLVSDPSYGEPQEVVMHITKGEDGYVFSESDSDAIVDLFCEIDRHWTEERAGEAVEAVLGGIYGDDYAGVADWTFSTEQEVRDTFGSVFSPESEKTQMEKSAADLLADAGINETYTVYDSLAEKVSKADRMLLKATKYEVTGIEDPAGNREEYEVEVRLTPCRLDSFIEDRDARLKKEMSSLGNVGQFLDRYYELSAEIIGEIVANEEYGDPVDRVLHLTYNSNEAYEMDYDELVGLFSLYDFSNGSVNSVSSSDEVRDRQESSSDADSKTTADTGPYTHGKDIPIRVRNTDFTFGRSTMQDVLDATGFPMKGGSKSVEADKLEWGDVEIGTNGVYMTLYVSNKSASGTRDVKECNVYEIFYNNFHPEENGLKDLVSVGGIRAGDTKDDVLRAFGVPEASERMDEDSISYRLDDGKYTLLFFIEEDKVAGFAVTSYDF